MTNPLTKFPRFVLLSGVYALFILLGTVTAQGATYYVATTGNDSNPGTSASPWRNPQRCTTSPIRAGDTCIVRSGTYTDTDGNGPVVWVYNRSSTPSGTASQPITIKSEKPLGAAIVGPSNRNGWGFLVQKPYYVIEGFDISGVNNNSSTAGGAGVAVTVPGNGTIIRSNAIHHIGGQSCTTSNNGFTGVSVKDGVSGVLIEQNRISYIGRKGCVAPTDAHDPAIYIRGAENTTIRRNVIYNMIRGVAIQVYGGTTTNLNIYHNTLHGYNTAQTAHILLSSTIRTANVKNNTSSDARLAMVRLYGLTASGVTISNNLSSGSMRFGSASGVTFSNNIENTNPAFISKSTNDFRLTSSSPVINRGTTSGVPPVPDGRPDSSAYEYSLQSNTASPLTPTGVRSL
ncbi:MAG TPA: right-handed parallel beta-helix repeat-containing protein [Nitrospira sp.]|nr:right-handed parallel beta-helix repeat-containing protein [Nitrospira sp.]